MIKALQGLGRLARTLGLDRHDHATAGRAGVDFHAGAGRQPLTNLVEVFRAGVDQHAEDVELIAC